MINLNRIGDQINGSFPVVEDGKTITQNFSITYSDKKMKQLQKIEAELAKAETMEDAKKVLAKFAKAAVETKADFLSQVTQNIYVNEKDGRYYLKEGDAVSSVPMPKSLVTWIDERLDRKDDVTPIINFWTRLLRNPNIRDSKQATLFAEKLCNYVTEMRIDPKTYKEQLEAGFSEQRAKEMATVPQTPLTQSGLICTKKVVDSVEGRMKYKFVWDEDKNATKRVLREDRYTRVVNEDTGEVTEEPVGDLFNEDWIFIPAVQGYSGDAFHMGDSADLGHHIKVGQEMWLDSWSQVNCNNNQTCVPGIHTGNHDYIRGYQKETNVTLECFVCPSQVGAVAASDSVLRVKSLFPYAITNREMANKNFYHHSQYAQRKDGEWATERAEVIKRFEDKKAELIKELDQQISEVEMLG
jgi:hypothetical protein